MDPSMLRAYGKDMVEMVAQYWENIEAYPVLSTIAPYSIVQQIPPEAPEDPESWDDIKKDINEIIMPGITHWHSPRFNAYFPAGNSYPAICADILCNGIGCIGFSWIASPACTELEIAMMNWLGKLLQLPEEFLYGPHSKGGGIIQGTASESTYIALLAAKVRIANRYQQQLRPEQKQRHHRPKSLPKQQSQHSVSPPISKKEPKQQHQRSQESVQCSELHLAPQPLECEPVADQARQGGIVELMTYSIDHVKPGTSEPVVLAPYCTVVKQPKIKMDIAARSSVTTVTGGDTSLSSPPMYGIMSTFTTTVTTVTHVPDGGKRIPPKTKPDKDHRLKKQPVLLETNPVQKAKHIQKASKRQTSEKTPATGAGTISGFTSVPVAKSSAKSSQYSRPTVTSSNHPYQGQKSKTDPTPHLSTKTIQHPTSTVTSSNHPHHSQKSKTDPTPHLLTKPIQHPTSTVTSSNHPHQNMGCDQKCTVTCSSSSSSADTFTLKTVTSLPLPPVGGRCFHDRLVAYTSIESHSSVEKAGLLGSVRVRLLPIDSQCSLRGATLEDAIKEDRAKGDVPFLIVATLGTTSSVAFDNIKELGTIAQREGMWMHIDAAYAGSAFICPEFRHILDGVELVDSFNFNPHKWLLINFDCSAMWVKNTQEITEAFMVNPEYLSHEEQGKVPDFRHWQIALGRRFRSLKLWFTFRLLGAKGLRKHIITQVNLAREFHRDMMQYEYYEFIGDNNLGTICFRIKGSNELNDELHNRINKAGKIYITKSEIHTVPKLLILRFAICSPLTRRHHIKEAIHEINHHACKVMKKVARQSEATNSYAPPCD